MSIPEKLEENNSRDVEFLDERLPLKSKIAYGFAQAGNGMLSGMAIGGAITIYYNVKLGLDETTSGVAWLIFAFWNAINDPLFGILQERIDTKIGRRIPILRYGAPIYALTFIFCWFPVFGSAQTALFWNLLLVLFLVDSMYTMIGLVTYILPAEMTLTQKGRSNLGVFSTYLGAIGIIVAMVLPMILLSVDENNPTYLNPFFKPAMVIVGILAGSLIFASSFFLVENEYAKKEKPLGFIKSIVETFKNREFILFEASNFFYILAYNTLTTGIFYFVPYILGYEGIMSSLPLVIVFAMIFGFTIVADRFVRKYGLKKVYMAGLFLASFTFMILLGVGRFEIPSLIVFALIGIAFAPISLINGPLMADVIDNDEILTGKRRETTYAGMNALVTKPAISAANALFLFIINAFGFDNSPGAIQTEQTKLGIIIALTVIPALSLLISAIILRWYKLDGKEWKKKKEELNRIHLQKEKEYIENLRKEGKISATYQKLYKEEN